MTVSNAVASTRDTPVIVVGTVQAARKWARDHRVSWRRVSVVNGAGALSAVRGAPLSHVMILPGHEHLAIDSLWTELQVLGDLGLIANSPPVPDLPDPDATAASPADLTRAVMEAATEAVATVRAVMSSFEKTVQELEQQYGAGL